MTGGGEEARRRGGEGEGEGEGEGSVLPVPHAW